MKRTQTDAPLFAGLPVCIGCGKSCACVGHPPPPSHHFTLAPALSGRERGGLAGGPAAALVQEPRQRPAVGVSLALHLQVCQPRLHLRLAVPVMRSSNYR